LPKPVSYGNHEEAKLARSTVAQVLSPPLRLALGAGVALTVMMLCLDADRGMARHGMDVAMKLVDDFAIIPGGVGTALTSLIYSIWTPWGWFKHRWITAESEPTRCGCSRRTDDRCRSSP
jgi:hypothetical protein